MWYVAWFYIWVGLGRVLLCLALNIPDVGCCSVLECAWVVVVFKECGRVIAIAAAIDMSLNMVLSLLVRFCDIVL